MPVFPSAKVRDRKALEAARANPDMAKVQMIQANGSGSGHEGAAAVLGASNIVQMMDGLDRKAQQKQSSHK